MRERRTEKGRRKEGRRKGEVEGGREMVGGGGVLQGKGRAREERVKGEWEGRRKRREGKETGTGEQEKGKEEGGKERGGRKEGEDKRRLEKMVAKSRGKVESDPAELLVVEI